MVLPNLGPAHDLGKRLSTMESNIAKLSTRDVLQHASIGVNGLTVQDGGSITITGGGSLTVTDSGNLNVASGGLNSAGSISAGTSITAGTTITATGALSGATVAATGNATIGGTTTSTGIITSPGTRGNVISTSWVSLVMDASGNFGYAPSTIKSKKDLTPFTEGEQLLNIGVYHGRFIWDADTAPLRSFLLAEEVQKFYPDMVPCDEAGNPVTINYSQLTVPIVALLQTQHATLVEQAALIENQASKLAALDARLTAAGL